MIPLHSLFILLSKDFNKYIDVNDQKLIPYIKDYKFIMPIFNPDESYESIKKHWYQLEDESKANIESFAQFSGGLEHEKLSDAGPILLEIKGKELLTNLILPILNKVKFTKDRLGLIIIQTTNTETSSKPGKEWLHLSYTMLEIIPKQGGLLQLFRKYLETNCINVRKSGLLIDKSVKPDKQDKESA